MEIEIFVNSGRSFTFSSAKINLDDKDVIVVTCNSGAVVTFYRVQVTGYSVKE
jgi:hypothetical protein